jgi:hypothetical protein
MLREVIGMRVMETIQGIKGSFYLASLSGHEQSVQRVEQFWSSEGIRADYSGESDLYIARDKRWLHLDHVRKEIRYIDPEDATMFIRFGSADERKLLMFVQQLLQQAGIKVAPPKKWKGNYFGVPANFTELRSVDGDLRFQLVLGTIDRWTLPLRLCIVTGADSMFVRDTLSVRQQAIPKGTFAPPSDYKKIP